MNRLLFLLTLIFCVPHSSQSWADIQVQGYLNKAAMENLAGDPDCITVPANCPDGRIYWNTTANEPRIWDGSAWQEMLVGAATVPDPLLLGDGSAGAPTYSFTNQDGTGHFREANELNTSVNGVLRQSVRASGASSVLEIGTVTQAGVSRLDLLTDQLGSDDAEVRFGGTSDGRILFDHSGVDMRFFTNGNEVFQIESGATSDGQILVLDNNDDNNPAYSFNSSKSTGHYWDTGNNALRFVVGGTRSAAMTAGRFFGGDSTNPTGGTASAPQIAISGDGNSGLYRDASDIGISLNGVTYFKSNSSGARVSMLKGASSLASISACYFSSGAGLSGFDECSSSIRYKENVRDISDEQIALVDDLRPVTFDWKETGERDYGLIAEEVAEVIPELANSSIVDGEVQHNGVKYRHMVALLLAKIQKMEKRIETLEAQ